MTAAALDRQEQERLVFCERVIARSVRSLWEAGEALATIRDDRLYRATHPTFEAYCRDRWDLSRPYAYQLIAAAEVRRNLESCDVLPENERQVRALAPLEPEQQLEVWQEVVRRGRPTGKLVDRLARSLRGLVTARTRRPDPEQLTEAELDALEAEHQPPEIPACKVCGGPLGLRQRNLTGHRYMCASEAADYRRFRQRTPEWREAYLHHRDSAVTIRPTDARILKLVAEVRRLRAAQKSGQ